MNEQEARELIGVGDRFAIGELKSLFRNKAFSCHPDMQGTNAEFVRLNEAFECLKKTALANSDLVNAQTEDGTPLVELGKGYPLSVSAVSCKNCEGNGYKRLTGERRAKCPDCDGGGAVFVPCNKCKGTGVYKNPRTGREVGECNMCLGTGRFYPVARRQAMPRNIFEAMFGSLNPVPVTLKSGKVINAQPCLRCDGNGMAWINDETKPFYVVCDDCKGVGEIQLFNPVIPRGMFAKLAIG